MVRLALLTLPDGLMNCGYTPLIATRTVAADIAALQRYLSDAENQWRLAGSFADVVSLAPAGARCDAELRLAFGARCHASAHVQPSRSEQLLAVQIGLGRRMVVWATWILTPGRGTTEVDLAAQFESRSLATRLVLLLGGRRWIAHRLDAALAALATTCARVAEDVAIAPSPPTTDTARHKHPARDAHPTPSHPR